MLPEIRLNDPVDGLPSIEREDYEPKRRGLPERIASRLRTDAPIAILDLAIIVAAYLAPLVLRFEGSIPGEYWRTFWAFIPIAGFLHLLANYLLGLYGQMWRYASIQEARRVVLAGAVGAVFVLGAAILLSDGQRLVPVSVAAMGSVLSIAGFGAIRFQSRLFAFKRAAAADHRVRLLLIGAGDAGAMVLKDILKNPSLGLNPLGFIDDDRRKRGLALHGVAVLGDRTHLPSLLRKRQIDQVFLTAPSATSEVVREVAAMCGEAEVTLRVLPSVSETMNGKVTVRDVRDLQIEDLLGRQQVATDLDSVGAMLGGQRVLITGAGGSIGSEIVRQVSTFGPATIILLDNDETHLHDVMIDLGGCQIEIVLADIRDRDRMLSVFATYRPQVVFHAAAHKHVNMLEISPSEAVLTNILGTANVADAAMAADVERFVLISTDKAIKPTSVMGASKWMAEQIVRSLQWNGCTFCAVRFGNVLGSRGSVIPTFLKQIAGGGPVTVTDASMARYFMSVQEAVQLVLQAGALSKGGEVFTLDMGEPVNILDLAKKLIRLSGRVPGRDIPIEITGPRPGEKLVEEIVASDEEVVASEHPSIVVSRPPVPDAGGLRRAIWDLESLSKEGRNEDLATLIRLFATSRFELPEEIRL